MNETKVYKLAFDLAMKIFEVSIPPMAGPKEEKYSLIDQIRRSGRSVCACLSEAHRKRLYEAYFVSKVSVQIWKTQKLKPGLSLRWLVYTSHKKNMMNF